MLVETERLLVRPFRDDDFDDLFRLLTLRFALRNQRPGCQGDITTAADDEEGENDQDTNCKHLPGGLSFPQDSREVLRFVQ